MTKDFLYCEETDTKIRNNDIVTISTYPGVKWIAKHGWYLVGTAQKNGWYFVSLTDKTIMSIDMLDIKDIVKEKASSTTIEVRAEVPEASQEEPKVDVLYCSDSGIKIYHNDIVTIFGVKYIAKFGQFTYDGEVQKNWHFVSLDDRTVLPIKDVNLENIVKDEVLATSEYRPTLKDIDATPPKLEYIVIPGTNIRLYDSDIVKISNKPDVKWVVHQGWYIYDNIQNFGWYFVSILNGEILPATIVDLTLCTLVTVKTQGSGLYDGKVVNYTRPFTLEDAETLNRTFITVDTIEQRDNLDTKKLINGRLVRVNDVGGVSVYYAWAKATDAWEKVDFGGGSGGSGIPELVGTEINPIILSKIEPGLYRILGYYKIAPEEESIVTGIDHLVFTSDTHPTQIKVITETSIKDFTVPGTHITFSNEYTTKNYVDNKISWIEQQISTIIQELYDNLPNIIDERIEQVMKPIPESFIRGLFT